MANVTRRYRRTDIKLESSISKLIASGVFISLSSPEPGQMVDAIVDNTNTNYAIDSDNIMNLEGFTFVSENPVTSLEIDAAGEIPPVNRIRESGGTELSIGSVSNGQNLQRSGSSIIGVAPGGGGSFDQRDVFLHEHFLSGNTDIDEIGVMGWRTYSIGTGNDITFFMSQAGRPGILQLNGGTAGTSRAAIALGDELGVGGRTILGGTNPINLEFLMRFPSASDLLVANIERMECGFGLDWNPDVQLPNALVVRYDPAASSFWSLVAANAGVRTVVSTGIAPVAGIWARCKIVFTTGLGAELFINGASVASLNTNIPVIAVGVGIKISANSGIGCMGQWDYIIGTQVTNKEGA